MVKRDLQAFSGHSLIKWKFVTENIVRFNSFGALLWLKFHCLILFSYQSIVHEGKGIFMNFISYVYNKLQNHNLRRGHYAHSNNVISSYPMTVKVQNKIKIYTFLLCGHIGLKPLNHGHEFLEGFIGNKTMHFCIFTFTVYFPVCLH